MPRVIRSLPQTSHTVTRHVAKQITRDFIKRTGFKEDFEVLLEEEYTGGAKQLRNLFDGGCEGDAIRTQYKNYAFISVNERYLEDHVNLSRWQNAYMPDIFTDAAHGIRIRPHYATAIVELQIRLRSTNLSTLNAWREALRITHGTTNLNWRHEVSYDYAIPGDYLSFLHDAFLMMEEQFPEDNTLGNYLRTHFRKGIQKRSNLNNTQHDVIMVEKQEHVLGIATEEFFYNEKEITEGIYEVTIPYRYEYKKPLALTMNVPATVRNKTIPKAYVKAWVPEVDRKTEEEFQPLYNVSGYDPVKNPLFHIGDGGSRLREWDDWFPNSYYTDCQTLCITPVRVTHGNPRELFNITDIADKYLPAAVKTYLKDFHAQKGYYFDSIVVIEVFAVGEEEELILHDLDEKLNLTSTVDLDIRKRYYVRFSLMKDLALYSSYETEKLLRMPEKAVELFKLYDPDVVLTQDSKLVEKVLPPIDRPGRFKNQPSLLYNPGNTGISSHSYTLWLRKLPQTNKLFLNLTPKANYSVTNMNISAHRSG